MTERDGPLSGLEDRAREYRHALGRFPTGVACVAGLRRLCPAPDGGPASPERSKPELREPGVGPEPPEGRKAAASDAGPER